MLPSFTLMQYDTMILNILIDSRNSQKYLMWQGVLRSILAVFIIQCGVQPPRWSTQLIKAKYYLFTSFWCIINLISISFCTMTIWNWRVPSVQPERRRGERPAVVSTQNYVLLIMLISTTILLHKLLILTTKHLWSNHVGLSLVMFLDVLTQECFRNSGMSSLS